MPRTRSDAAAAADESTLLMTVEECARTLKVDDGTITALVESGKWIGSHRIGRRCIISRAAFNRLYRDGIVTEARPARSPFLQEVRRAS